MSETVLTDTQGLSRVHILIVGEFRGEALGHGHDPAVNLRRIPTQRDTNGSVGTVHRWFDLAGGVVTVSGRIKCLALHVFIARLHCQRHEATVGDTPS